MFAVINLISYLCSTETRDRSGKSEYLLHSHKSMYNLSKFGEYYRCTKYHVYGIEVAIFDGKVPTAGRIVATLKRRMSREELVNIILEVCYEWRTIYDTCVL